MVWKLIPIVVVVIVLSILLLLSYQQLNFIPLNNIRNLNLFTQNIKQEKLPSPPSLNHIFNNDHNWIATLSAQQVKTIIATGDIIPARSVNYQAMVRKDFTWPYLKTASVIKDADITFINLESPLIGNCPLTQEGMIFCGDIQNLAGLIYAGVDVVNLANNHLANHGKSGVTATENLLNNNGILTTGINGAVFKNIKGTNFAFLGYNDISKPQSGISNVDEEKIQSEIAAAKKQADVVIVTFHWGTEYQSQPDQRQRNLGYLAIDSGADLIIGNHPHWIQPVELYKGNLITYAHGNFIFDQMWSQKTREGVVGKYTFFDKDLIDVQFMPVQINDYGQPVLLENPQKQIILNEMKEESLKLVKGPN